MDSTANSGQNSQEHLHIPTTTTTSPAETPQSPTPPTFSNGGKKEKGRVRFNSTAGTEPRAVGTAGSSTEHGNPSAAPVSLPVPRPRPSVLRGNSYNSVTSVMSDMSEADDPNSVKARQAYAAQERAQHVAASLLGSYSAPGSRRNSMDSDAETISSGGGFLSSSSGIPLNDMSMTIDENHTDGHEDGQKHTFEDQRAMKKAAYDLVRTHTQRGHHSTHVPLLQVGDPGSITRPSTPVEEKDFAEHYVPPPDHYRGGVLSHLLKLYKPSESTTPTERRKPDISGFSTPISSGTATPTRRRWYDQNKSQDTLANLVEASARLGALGNSPGVRSSVASAQDTGSPLEKVSRPKRPKHKRASSSRLMSFGRPRIEDEIKITIHIAETLSRQKYIIKLCRALMLYGAPTHRLEEYLQMTARMLEIDSQYLYLPGCMIISFDDRSTHTAEVKIVRTAQGIELGKLKDVHEIYKEVLHDVMGVDEAMDKLSKVMDSGDKYNKWLRVLGFGLASATVAPFGFEGRLIDMPMCFVLGCIVGYLQLIAAPASPIYNNVFEVGATIITSFIARGLGSIGGPNNYLFCFSAMAQSSIALILPGWLVLCAALELQSKAIVPGSIRMVYSIIYSLFLGFGITVGTVLYGLVDANATTETSCTNPIPGYYRFFFVPLFTICLAFVNQAKWKQMPVQIIIAFAGYVVNYFTNQRISAVPQLANTLGALAVGVLANLYSRVRHGVAAAALLPAIFVQVPSGLAATGSLLSGLEAANKVSNSTKAINGTATVTVSPDGNLNAVAFSVAATMIQIAIGITVGLFLSALIIYPLGKRRSGLFTL